ncbi:MAG: PAS domain S-box protein [Polyangiaceae bacterium]
MSASPIDPWLVLDAIDVGVVVHDATGKILLANSAAASLLGVSREALLAGSSHGPWDIVNADGEKVTPDDQPAMIAARTRAPVHGALLGVGRPTGDRIWLLVTALPRGEADDFRVVVSFTDATKEHTRFENVQSAHAASERRYEAVLRAMSEGLVIHDASGAIRFSNRGAERILGLTHEQLRGVEAIDPRWRLVRSDGTPLPADEIPSEITTKTGRAAHALLGVERGTGERAWLSVSSDCIAREGDASHGVVATFTDITALREAQLAEQQMADKLRAVVRATPGIIFQYERSDDGSERFTFIDGTVQEFIGVSAADVTADASQTWRYMHADDRPTFVAAMQRSRETLAPFDQTVRVVGADRVRFVRIRSNPERLGSVTRWTGVMLDVTEEHNLAEGLRRAQRREAMGDLAAGLAHNVTNMLAVILPNVEAAREAAPSVEAMLADASTATVRAAELVKQILYIARGTARSSRADVDLVQAVHDVVGLCRRTFDRAIRIVLDLTPDAAFTLASPSHVDQVILNLLLNARDALVDRPDPTIELRLTEVDAPLADAPRHYRLVVKDNGAGMDEATLSRLGEPFFTTKAPGRGTGLGLATIYGTMRDIGGTIDVMSELGRGTTFTLSYPAQVAASPRRQHVATESPIQKLRVLVVDDEELVRRTIRRMLEGRGHVVVEAAGGDEALALVPSDPTLDAVVLDLSMPGLSGRETLRRLTADGSPAPAPPVVVLTGDTSERGGLENAAALLEKPVNLASLLATLQRVTTRSTR